MRYLQPDVPGVPEEARPGSPRPGEALASAAVALGLFSSFWLSPSFSFRRGGKVVPDAAAAVLPRNKHEVCLWTIPAFFPSQCCSYSDVSQVTLSPLLCRARIFGSVVTGVVPTSVLWLLLEPTVRALPIQSSYCLPAGFPYHTPAQVTPQLTSVREPSHPTALMGHDFPLAFPPIPIPPS